MPTKKDLQKKFTFFYKPYNYIANTQKYMRFEDDQTIDSVEELRAIEPRWRNLKFTPWTDRRPESSQVSQRAVAEYLQDVYDC